MMHAFAFSLRGCERAGCEKGTGKLSKNLLILQRNRERKIRVLYQTEMIEFLFDLVRLWIL